MEELENGCIGLWEKSTDYLLTEWLLDALPALYQQDEIIYQYNQWTQERSEKSCTLFSPIWAISDLFNVEIPLDVIKERNEESYNRGRVRNNGRYVAAGVKHIVDMRNDSEFAKKYWKAAYYSIELKDDDLVKKILEKRYTICIWYQGNAAFNKDKKDWTLDETSFWSPTYGHAVSAIWSVNEKPQRIKDNYYRTLKNNIYDVAHPFSDISCFYDRGYVITKVAEDAIEEVKRLNEFRTNLLNSIELNSKMWHQTNDTNYQSILHYVNDKNRKKLADIDEQLKKYF